MSRTAFLNLRGLGKL